jgi:hypothetical protein
VPQGVPLPAQSHKNGWRAAPRGQFADIASDQYVCGRIPVGSGFRDAGRHTQTTPGGGHDPFYLGLKKFEGGNQQYFVRLNGEPRFRSTVSLPDPRCPLGS